MLYTKPITDTHLHLWDIEKFDYPWLKGQEYLKRTFTIDDFKEDTKDLNIAKMVFVECDVAHYQHMEETEYVTNIAKTKDSRIEGIVCFAPLEKGAEVRAELDILKQNPLIKGIRRMIQYEEDMEFCLQKNFIDGVKLLKEYGYTFDITIDYRHFKNTNKFIEKVGSEVKMMLDHFGKPGIKEGYFDDWSKEIGIMAQFPNVYCKLSSLPSEADWKNWTKEQLKPYAQRVLETFGYNKTVFGGDWPPVQRACSYNTCVELTMEFTEGSTEAEKSQLFYTNAIDFYNL